MKHTETEYLLFKLEIEVDTIQSTVYVLWKSMKDVLYYYEDWEVLSIEQQPDDVYISQWIVDDIKK